LGRSLATSGGRTTCLRGAGKGQVRVSPSAASRGGGDRGIGFGHRPVLEGVVEVLLGVLDLAHVDHR
jgi:hypothetical protein